MSTLDESHQLLEDATLILEDGRKYGLVGMNGCGKTTLLRRMSRYDLKGFPPHLRILHVEQEITGDDTIVLDYVLSCDVVRKELLEREANMMAERESIMNGESRLGDDANDNKGGNVKNKKDGKDGKDDKKVDEVKEDGVSVGKDVKDGKKDEKDGNKGNEKNVGDDEKEEEKEKTIVLTSTEKARIETISKRLDDLYELMRKLDVVDVAHRAKV